MIFASIDVETTGLTEDCEIVEVGVVVIESSTKSILSIHSDILKVDKWSDSAAKVHGISKSHSDLGHSRIDLFAMIAQYDPKLIVAHNAIFDKKFVCKYWPQFGNIKWLCTKDGLKHDKVNATSLKLGHLASDYNIGMQYKHRAVFDALTAGLIACEHDLDNIFNSKNVRISVKYDGRPDFRSKKFNAVKQFLKDNGFRYTTVGGWWVKENADDCLRDKLTKIANVSNWKMKSEEIEVTI